ncbi:hypothetical protein [Catenulispora rubra]|uniref:hypothetical protein n=1 Tax=Catenulispora rubra TaxID=280293 RepID=UPI0018926269|nr:hypothetical protein [Catenulispora rubra]
MDTNLAAKPMSARACRSQRPAVFLRIVNGSGAELLRFDRAEALLKQMTALALPVRGDLQHGYGWQVAGAVPRRAESILPLAAPTWPATPFSMPVVMELWWDPGEDGYRQVRTFTGFFNDPYETYLAVCCLWGTEETGRGARAAYIYSPDRTTLYRVDEMAKTCSQLSPSTIAMLAATKRDRSTTDPLPDELEGIRVLGGNSTAQAGVLASP